MEATLWFTLIAILILIAISGFFSGSETALTAASRARMHQKEKSGEAAVPRLSISSCRCASV